jgi:hypothetical protein
MATANRLLINEGSFLLHYLGQPLLVLRLRQGITVAVEQRDRNIMVNIREVNQRWLATAIDLFVFLFAKVVLPKPLILKAVNLGVVQNRVKAGPRRKMAQEN